MCQSFQLLFKRCLFAALPTYEECMMMGHVDIREEDDNEYIRGELSWAPKYPMYRQLSYPQAPSD